jgi:hypothetical protein
MRYSNRLRERRETEATKEEEWRWMAGAAGERKREKGGEEWGVAMRRL